MFVITKIVIKKDFLVYIKGLISITNVYWDLIMLPLSAETLSRCRFEHFDAWQVCFSSRIGHWFPPFDSGLKISRVRTDVPIPHETSHFDQSLHSLTWQSITEKKISWFKIWTKIYSFLPSESELSTKIFLFF